MKVGLGHRLGIGDCPKQEGGRAIWLEPKLKRLQNLAADQCRGMRWNLRVAPRSEDLRI